MRDQEPVGMTGFEDTKANYHLNDSAVDVTQKDSSIDKDLQGSKRYCFGCELLMRQLKYQH